MKKFVITIIILFIFYSIAINWIEKCKDRTDIKTSEFDIKIKVLSDSLAYWSLTSSKLDNCCISDVIHDKKYIVFISNKSCETCTYEFLQYLKSFIPKDELLIITNDIDIRNLKFLKKHFDVDFSFYYLGPGYNIDHFNSDEFPFILSLKSEVKVKNFHSFKSGDFTGLKTFIEKHQNL